MDTIVTITELSYSRGSYVYDVTRKGKIKKAAYRAGNNPEAAAAMAVSVAVQHDGSYVILAPREVLDCIPESVRTRN